MRILLDTNVLISAFVFGGTAGRLLEKLFDGDFELLVSDYVEKEFCSKIEEKWPTKFGEVYSLYKELPFVFCESSSMREGSLRDPKDIPVLSDALFHQVDVILSGDKDFLEADLEYPLVLSPAMMLEFLEKKNR